MPKTNFIDFIKTAASTVGPSVMCVPAKMASDAFELYCTLPEEDKVKLAYNMYRQVKPGFNKIAMEMVAANILADIDRVDCVEKAANTNQPATDPKN